MIPQVNTDNPKMIGITFSQALPVSRRTKKPVNDKQRLTLPLLGKIKDWIIHGLVSYNILNLVAD